MQPTQKHSTISGVYTESYQLDEPFIMEDHWVRVIDPESRDIEVVTDILYTINRVEVSYLFYNREPEVSIVFYGSKIESDVDVEVTEDNAQLDISIGMGQRILELIGIDTSSTSVLDTLADEPVLGANSRP